MKCHPRVFLSLAFLLVVTSLSLITRSVADEGDQISVASFAGKWQMTIIGQTGCGFGTSVYYATIPANGSGTAMSTFHTAGCGDGATSSPVAFVIQSVGPDGSGRANLTCGPGCGWNLTIQMAPNRQIFNVVDIDAVNPGNFIEGTAVRQSW